MFLIFSCAFLFALLVFVHELGHFIFASKYGVHVEQFAIGMGPKLFSFKDKRNTEWIIALLPIGGYIKCYGDENITSANQKIKDVSKSHLSLLSKTPWQRFLISFGGPLFNFISAIIPLTLTYFLCGDISKIPL